MKVAIIINKKRMTPTLSAQLKSDELKNKYNIDYDVFITTPEELTPLLNQLNFQSYNAIIIGGGDGTVRCAFQQLSNHDIALAILPLGTFNLLAKTLEYPNDVDALFSIIKNNKTKQIDLASVNNNIIINHAWIGFYYYILKIRKKHQKIIGTSKLLKIIFNSMNAFKVLPIYHLRFKNKNEYLEYKTCLVYIGNNQSQTNLLDFGERKTLSAGILEVTILNCQTRWNLFLCLCSMLLGKFKDSQYIVQFTTDDLTITAKSNLINIVIDGDLFKLETPLQFVNHQKKLKMVVP